MRAAVPIGLYAALTALMPNAVARAAMASAPLMALLGWWLLNGANHWLVAFIAAALLLPPLPIGLGNAGPHPALAFAAVGFGIGLLRLREWKLRADPLAQALTIFFALLLASVASALALSGPAVAAGSLARTLLFGIAVYIYFFVAHGPGAGQRVDAARGARWLYGVAMAAAAFACVDFYFQFPAPAGYGPQYVWLMSGVFRRAQGLFYEASTLGNFCVFFLVMIAVTATLPRQARLLSWPALLVGGAVFSTALVFSYSRASLAALAAALVALAYMRRGVFPLARWLLIVVVSLAAGALIVYLAFPAYGEIYSLRLALSVEQFLSQTNAILSGRLVSWSAVYELLTANPWYALTGVGYKTLPYSDVAGRPLIVDNMYLTLLAETGVLGVTAFLALNVALLAKARNAARSRDAQASFFGVWIFCFWCGELVQMLSGDLLTYWRVLPLYFWVLATAVRRADAAAE
ncbi:MAG: O-antigen ligase family protein [Bryobacteraceae bacterium]|nr:O-antigen ligase family protein [Bryobacteraceae bacterium]